MPTTSKKCQNFKIGIKICQLATLLWFHRSNQRWSRSGVPEWTPAGVCILGWSRSQYFRFEPESTLRSAQEPIKIFKGPNFCNDGCCWQTEWNQLWRVFWPMSSYITEVWHRVGVPSISPQRWLDSGYLLSDPILFLKNDIRSESCFG